MAAPQGGAPDAPDAAPLVLEILRVTNLPPRENDRLRSPFLRIHLEPAEPAAAGSAAAGEAEWEAQLAASETANADAPPPLPPRSPEVSPTDLAKLMAQKSLSAEEAARVWDALAATPPPPAEEQPKDATTEQPKGRWSRTRAAAAALQKRSSSAASALRARSKDAMVQLKEAQRKHLDETQPPGNAMGSTAPVETSPRPNTLQPQFFAFLRVAERCALDDVVVVRVFDAASTRTKYLGEARVPAGFLSSTETPFAVTFASEKHNTACEVHLRRVPVAIPPPRTVPLILVRHGQSIWNEAKHDANYSAMVSKRDHPLTPQGVAQACSLNDKWRRALARDFGARPLPFLGTEEASGYLGSREDAAALEKVDAVWASPLTRALQTALVGFCGLPALRNLSLHPSCREVKNVGGFDSVGLETGSRDILKRCEKKLTEAVLKLEDAPTDTASNLCGGLACDARDAAAEWWLPAERREGDTAVDRRCAEFLREVQYEGAAPLVVSHSHFIRGLFKRFRDPTDLSTKPFSVKKVANCGVVAVDVVFDDATGGAPSLRNPRLLFGSTLEGDDATDEDSDEDPSRLERARTFGSGVLAAVGVRRPSTYSNTSDPAAAASVDLLTGDDLDGPLFEPMRAAPSESVDDGSLL